MKGQTAEGGWQLLHEWQPISSTPDVITTEALLALSSPTAPDLGEAGKAAREKGLKWLDSAKQSDDPQALALRYLLWKRLGRSKEADSLANRLAAKQNADGSWSFANGEPGDAYTTGQALYVLLGAGRKPEEAAMRKAAAFLLKTQTVYGGWEQKSRTGGPREAPAKDSGPISHVASAWATLGLLRCSPSVN